MEWKNENPKEFLCCFITVDGTWIHHYQPEIKKQSKQWVASGESALKKAKTVLSVGKVMTTILWDALGIIFIDILQKGKTVTGQYYASLLDRLNDKNK